MDENNLDEQARLKAEQEKLDRAKMESRENDPDSPAQFANAAKQITQEEIIRDANEVARREPDHEIRESARERELTEWGPQSEDQVERDRLHREKMESRGYDPDSPVQSAEFQMLQDKVEAKQITEWEVGREMNKVAYLERDSGIREAAQEKLSEQSLGGQEQVERDQRDREKMDSRGHNSDSPEQLAEFQRLQDKVEAKQITEWEMGREMNKVAYLERDNGIQEAAREKLNEPSLGIQDQAERDQRDREKMESRGYNSESPEQLAEFQRLRDKVEAKQITEWELGRGMNKAAYPERDNGLQEAARESQLSEPPGPDINKDREPKGLAHSNERDDEPTRPGIGLEVPTPYRQESQQRPREAEERQPEQKPFMKRVMDWERMLTDPAYRKEMEQQAKEERAFRLQQMGQERGGGMQRTGTGGRGR
jgi:hypothetical protein